ncbi:uncharacterized protein BDZ99DRAFT_51469 [Mytilinidion resinicola]|uniref:Myb-like domain-containing protein n=1 Tax=Mytilinidion resinicola TaxID=574789 RepID=A0A6A6YHQ4_9PEZI|nr:uncharacterized protein BDZ99DRAFT_51469 [Mytilinidion resinicola]KAF2808300.1 hypothetical protein BDZ99DRAFT_51469 [Mytilinidion resinicola]
MRFRKRTYVLWLESDELRWLAYKKDMDMEWKDIFELFLDRTPGAVRTRWHILQGKRSVDATNLLGLPATNTDAVAPRDDGRSSESLSDDDNNGEHLKNNETSRQGKKAKSHTSTERPQKRLRTQNSLQTRPHERGKKQRRLLEDEVLSSRASPEPYSKQIRREL